MEKQQTSQNLNSNLKFDYTFNYFKSWEQKTEEVNDKKITPSHYSNIIDYSIGQVFLTDFKSNTSYCTFWYFAGKEKIALIGLIFFILSQNSNI